MKTACGCSWGVGITGKARMGDCQPRTLPVWGDENDRVCLLIAPCCGRPIGTVIFFHDLPDVKVEDTWVYFSDRIVPMDEDFLQTIGQIEH